MLMSRIKERRGYGGIDREGRFLYRRAELAGTSFSQVPDNKRMAVDK
jgi:hypothetical protein